MDRQDQPFRLCRVCGRRWATWEDFVLDPAVELIGLQAIPSIPSASVVVFLHAGCGSISVQVRRLRQIPEFAGTQETVHGELGDCDGCYRDLGQLADCQKSCVVASERRLTLRVLEFKRRGRR